MKIFLDTKKNFPYTEPMFYSNPITVKSTLKAAWHIYAVAEEAFY